MLPWRIRRDRQEESDESRPTNPGGLPAGHAVSILDGGAAAIDFYRGVFGASERSRLNGPDGKIGHAELVIGNSLIMLSDEYPELDVLGPKTVGGTPVTISVYVEDVDVTFERALRAGAKALREVKNQFYGDRSGQFEDPFGHRWSVATHVEDVSPDEMAKRANDAMAAGEG